MQVLMPSRGPPPMPSMDVAQTARNTGSRRKFKLGARSLSIWHPACLTAPQWTRCFTPDYLLFTASPANALKQDKKYQETDKIVPPICPTPVLSVETKSTANVGIRETPCAACIALYSFRIIRNVAVKPRVSSRRRRCLVNLDVVACA